MRNYPSAMAEVARAYSRSGVADLEVGFSTGHKGALPGLFGDAVGVPATERKATFNFTVAAPRNDGPVMA